MNKRRAIWVQGTIHGVGLRPFVFGLASNLKLGGFVRNQTGGVQIEVKGDAVCLDEFLSHLTQEPPPLARIENISWQLGHFLATSSYSGQNRLKAQLRSNV